MCKRNGTYGITHFTRMWVLFMKQRLKFAISLLNGKRTNYSFGGLFCHTRQLSGSPRSRTAGALCAAPSITSVCLLPAETRPRPRALCTPSPAETGGKFLLSEAAQPWWFIPRVPMAGLKDDRNASSGARVKVRC